MALDADSAQAIAQADMTWTIECSLQRQARTITVLAMPGITVHAPREQFKDTANLLHLISCDPRAGGRLIQDPIFFWVRRQSPC